MHAVSSYVGERMAASASLLATPPTTVIFCRHGETEGNRESRFGGHGPTPLTELGRAQARAAGRVLARVGVDAIYTSDLLRAEQTAALIGETLGVVPQATAALRERSVGCLTGLTFDEARARYAEVVAALLSREPNSSPPGGESYAQCRERASAFLRQAVARHAGQSVLFVSHQITLWQLIQEILGIQADQSAAGVQFQVDHCALHRFERLEDAVWKVVALNERVPVLEQ